MTTVGFTAHNVHGPSATQLTLYRAFDSTIGRWLSEDPTGFAEGPNWYGYVGSNPLKYRDPLGLWAVGFGGGGGGGGAIGFGGAWNATAQIVWDGTYMGIMFCGSAGGAIGLGAAVGGQFAAVSCPECKTICDLEGWSITEEVTVASGPGISVNHSGNPRKKGSPKNYGGSVGGRGGFGGWISGQFGGCVVIPFDKCLTC